MSMTENEWIEAIGLLTTDDRFSFMESPRLLEFAREVRELCEPTRPSAWYRVHWSPRMHGPGEADYEMSWGDDVPDGEGWHPLYTQMVTT